MVFSECFRCLIKSRGLSASEVARMAPVERSMLSKAVNGAKLPKSNVLNLLCDFLRLNPNEAREMLGHLIEDIRRNHVSTWLIDETLLPIPSYLTIGMSDHPVAVFLSRQIAKKHIPYFSIVIGESIIDKALYDFIMYLPTSKYVHEPQEALDFLESYLAKAQ